MDRRLEIIPLTDDERSAVEGDSRALGILLDKLADTPTPDGSMRNDMMANRLAPS
jgi:hypothetical protein